MKHVIVIEDSPDDLTVTGEVLSEHRSLRGVKVEQGNVVEVLRALAERIVANERRYHVLDEIDASE